MASGSKYEDLELLRGVAALGVVVYHFQKGFALPTTLPVATDLLHASAPVLIAPVNGPFMVAVFFVLSSYALTVKLVRSSQSRLGFVALLKRFPRLLPLTLAGTLLPAGLAALGLMRNHEAAVLTGSRWLDRNGGIRSGPNWPEADIAGGFADALLLFARGASQYNSAPWTMKYELLGSSLALITAIIIAGRMRPKFDLVVGAVLAIFGLWIHPLCALCVVTVLLTKRLVYRPVILETPAALVAIGIGLAMGSTYKVVGDAFLGGSDFTRYVWRVDWAIHCLGALFVFAGVHCWRRSSGFSWGPARWLGDLSFSVYVIHTPIIGSVASLVVLAAGFNSVGIGLAFMCSMFVIYLLATPLARFDQWWVRKVNAVAAGLTFRNPAGVIGPFTANMRRRVKS